MVQAIFPVVPHFFIKTIRINVFLLSFVVLATSERRTGKNVKIGRVSCPEPTGLGALFTACAT